MRPTKIEVSSATSSPWIPLDHVQKEFNVGLQVVGTNTPSFTWAVEMTLDDVFDKTITPVAIPVPTASGMDTGSGGTNEVGNLTIPCRAVRLTLSVYTSGTATLTVIQGS